MITNKEEKKMIKCCLCGEICENLWGNNPWPLNKKEDDRCCDVCNYTKVIPARIKLSKKKDNDKSSTNMTTN